MTDFDTRLAHQLTDGDDLTRVFTRKEAQTCLKEWFRCDIRQKWTTTKTSGNFALFNRDPEAELDVFPFPNTRGKRIQLKDSFMPIMNIALGSYPVSPLVHEVNELNIDANSTAEQLEQAARTFVKEKTPVGVGDLFHVVHVDEDTVHMHTMSMDPSKLVKME